MRRAWAFGAVEDHPEVVRALFKTMRGVFSSVHGYYGIVPTYPGGGWVFCLAGDDARPEAVDEARAGALDTRYFSPRTARGVFALPPFIEELVS